MNVTISAAGGFCIALAAANHEIGADAVDISFREDKNRGEDVWVMSSVHTG